MGSGVTQSVVTLADADTSSILTDDANRTIPGNMTITNASGAVWWPNMEPIQAGATWWPKLELVQVLVAKCATNKVTRVTDSTARVRCASGNVSVLHQNEGDIGKSIPDAQEISRDILRVEGNLRGEYFSKKNLFLHIP